MFPTLRAVKNKIKNGCYNNFYKITKITRSKPSTKMKRAATPPPEVVIQTPGIELITCDLCESKFFRCTRCRKGSVKLMTPPNQKPKDGDGDKALVTKIITATPKMSCTSCSDEPIASPEQEQLKCPNCIKYYKCHKCDDADTGAKICKYQCSNCSISFGQCERHTTQEKLLCVTCADNTCSVCNVTDSTKRHCSCSVCHENHRTCAKCFDYANLIEDLLMQGSDTEILSYVCKRCCAEANDNLVIAATLVDFNVNQCVFDPVSMSCSHPCTYLVEPNLNIKFTVHELTSNLVNLFSFCQSESDFLTTKTGIRVYIAKQLLQNKQITGHIQSAGATESNSSDDDDSENIDAEADKLLNFVI